MGIEEIQVELDISVMDKFIEKHTERIRCCVDTCFGVPNEKLKFSRYEELLEKAKKYDAMQPNISAMFRSMDRLLKITKLTVKGYDEELDNARKEAIKILHKLGR